MCRTLAASASTLTLTLQHVCWLRYVGSVRTYKACTAVIGLQSLSKLTLRQYMYG